MNNIQDEEHFLVFENQQHTISENIISYFNKEAFVNTTLVCCGEKIRAHQIILAACSPLFEKILVDQNHPDPTIVFTDITKYEMQILLQYIYVGRVSVPNSHFPSILKVAKRLELRGLKFDDLQSTFREDAANASMSDAAPNLSAILAEPTVHNTAAESPEHNNDLAVSPERTTERWLSAAHNSLKKKDRSKKVLNPFAKKSTSSTDSDSTVFYSDKAVAGSPRKSPKKETVTSPIRSTDSDIEIIDVNPIVVIPDSQVNDDTTFCISPIKRNISNSDGFSEANDGELVSSNPKKYKRIKSDGKSPVKVNPVALRNRSRDNMNNSHENENSSPKKSDKYGDLISGKGNQCAADKSDKRLSEDVARPCTSKSNGNNSNSKENRNAPKRFEDLLQMSLESICYICVICEKEYGNIKEHIKKAHSVPAHGKKLVCKVCSKKFKCDQMLHYHNCRGKP